MKILMYSLAAAGLYSLFASAGWEVALGAFLLVWAHNIEHH